ncbi:hypothetical protein ACOSQ4_033418 [Xanthoceras sorbifolium]
MPNLNLIFITSICANCAARNSTFWKLQDNFDDLEIELGRLSVLTEEVMRRAEAAEKDPQMIRTKKVEVWFSKVQDVKNDVDQLRKEVSEEIDKLRPGGFRSKNHKSISYELGRKVVDKKKYVTTLTKEGDFDVVAEKIIPECVADKRALIEEYSTIVGRESMLEQVWRCLEEKDVGILGLYGMGGVGKTTLLKQIKNKLLDTGNDHVKVIWVGVPDHEDPQLEGIQEQIKKEIGLFDEMCIVDLGEEEIKSSYDNKWENENVEERASEIFNILSQTKFVLLLDDVWKMIDLKQVGVPFPPNPESGSKIVFTTRSLEVCSLMEADAEFKVECLPYEEAWALFRTSVGDEALDSQTEVGGVAKAIVKECHGLPLALVTVGRAMACKQTPEEWRNELQGLKTSTSSFSGSGAKLKSDDVYFTLKLSYDRLENDMFKSCLVYCSLFPSGYKISKRDLIDYWIGEGLLMDRPGSQNQGYNIIDHLLDTCLLEEEEVHYVKIHGLIIEMILRITRESEEEEERRNFFVRTDAGLIEAPEIENWEDVRRVSLMENQIKNLDKFPPCPCLETLFLNRNRLEKIDGVAFGYMSSLKVLNLSDNFFLMELPSVISKLVRLQQLDLSKTGIKELPKTLMKLVNLKCLNLEHTYRLCRVPRHMISKFSKLQVLRLLNCGSSTDQPTEDNVLYNHGEFLVEELLCLKHLNMLSIALKSFQAVQKYLSSHKLQLCTQSLELQSLQDPIKSLKLPLGYLNHLKTLCISDCVALKELKIDFGREVENIRESRSFPFLDEVIIEYCSNMQDLTWLILAPNLKRLRITECVHMEQVINVVKLSEFPEMMANLVPFSKLKFLKLDTLPNLRSIYWNALPFPDLKTKEIQGCEQLQMFDKMKETVEERQWNPFLDPSPSSISLL